MEPQIAVAAVGLIGLITSGLMAGTFDLLKNRSKPSAPNPQQEAAAKNTEALAAMLAEMKTDIAILMDRSGRHDR